MSCYICMDEVKEEVHVTCKCKGSTAYVHQACLDEWKETQQGWNKRICSICRSFYDPESLASEIDELHEDTITQVDISIQLLDLLAKFEWKRPYDLVWERAITSNNEPAIQHMLTNKMGIDSILKAFEVAAGHGNLALIKILNSQIKYCGPQPMILAATSGHMEVVQFLYNNRLEEVDKLAIQGAARGGCLEILKFLYEKIRNVNVEATVSAAAQFDHADIVEYLLPKLNVKNLVTAKNLMRIATVNDNLEILKMICDHYPCIFTGNNNTLHIYSQCSDTQLSILLYFKTKYPEYFDGEYPTTAMDFASGDGNLDLVMFFHQYSKAGCTTDAMDRAAREGHLHVVKFLHENRTEGCTTNAMDDAACYNHLPVVQFLHSINKKCTTRAMDDAAALGRFSIVEFLHFNRTEGCTTIAMDRAALHGDFKILKFLHENRSEGCTTEAMDFAAGKGHLEIVKFLHENRIEGCTTRAMDAAANRGHFEIVKFLHENRHEGCTAEALDSLGKYDIIDFLLKNRDIDPLPKTMNMVYGDLNYLSLLLQHDKEVIITSSIINDVVTRGTLKVLEFIVEKELCDLSNMLLSPTIQIAAESGDLDILKYLYSKGIRANSPKAMDNAARRGRLDVISFLHQQNESCTTDAMDMAASYGYLNVVKFLHQNRKEGCTTDAMDGAARSGHLNVLYFLHYNRTEGCTTKAIDGASLYGHLSIIRFLHQNRKEGATIGALQNAINSSRYHVQQYLFDHFFEIIVKNHQKLRNTN